MFCLPVGKDCPRFYLGSVKSSCGETNSLVTSTSMKKCYVQGCIQISVRHLGAWHILALPSTMVTGVEVEFERVEGQ